MRHALAALALLAACTTDQKVVVRPVIETPAADTDGYPYDGLTDLVIAAAHAGQAGDIEVASTPIGQALSLEAVAFDDDLVLHLSGRVGDVETSYGRTCTFAVSASEAPSEPHLYFARIVRWAASAEPALAARVGGGAFATPDGRAVLVGGAGGAPVERFDPQDGAFHTLALEADMVPRTGASVSRLDDGRALIIGGVDGAGDGVPLVEVLDARPPPEAGVPLDSQPGPRLVDHASAALVDGTVVVIGGREQADAGEPFAVSSAAYLFRFGDGGVLDVPRRLDAQASVPRADHSATRLSDDVGADVLVVGGRGDDGKAIAEAELYRPLRFRFEPLPNALLNQPRWGHQAVRLPGGFVLIVGGFSEDPGGGDPLPVTSLEVYDPAQGVFTVAGELPADAGVNDMTVTELPDGRVLLAGGRDQAGEPTATVVIARLDSLTGQVDLSPTDPMEIPRAGHAAARLCDGTILVVGGTDGAAPGSERYNPPAAGRR